jgi:nitrogen fixation protein NifU and related proteins
MNSELRELYQDVILDHSKHPRNFGPDAAANRHAKGNNPLCGDRVEVHVRARDGRIDDAHFEGKGCAISLASASLMTELVKGRTEAEAKALFDKFHAMVTTRGPVDLDAAPGLDRLAALSGVRDFPMRVKCATLAWHTLAAALKGEDQEVRTE